PAAPIPATPVAPPEDDFITPEGYPRFSAWFLSMLLISFSVWVGYWFSRRFIVRRAAVRIALGMLVGGLIAYNYLVLGLPGGTDLLTSNGLLGALFAIFLGEILGFGAGLVWSRQ
ncbi:MAG TPA: hypothetical protein VJ180_02565, partial [Pyrinomonadaceae bacterium]|nr:hypothetical protein [Pyrinomonadaceae bacterium]